MKYKIGEMIFRENPITLNEGKEAIELIVNNIGDRTIQVCSHYHFFESNLALKFDREKAFGMRLDIPSGTAVRFEPGEDKKVRLIPYGGDRRVIGFLGLTMGRVDDPEIREEALRELANLEGGGNG